MAEQPSIIDQILDTMSEKGHMTYGERVNLLQHSVQAAVFAERDGADDLMIAAALLHDFGHFVHDLGEDIADKGIDAMHEETGAEWLKPYFLAEVIEPIRLHVAAKRYLFATDAAYRATVSPASIQSLQLQGGPFSAEEVRQFEANPHFKRAVALRFYDEAGKDPDMEVPELGYFRPFLEKALVNTTG